MLILQEEAAHDGVLLLDRAMSVAGAGVEACLVLSAAACLHLALTQDATHAKEALPALSSIAAHTGGASSAGLCSDIGVDRHDDSDIYNDL